VPREGGPGPPGGSVAPSSEGDPVQTTSEDTIDRVWRLPEPSAVWPADALALLEFANGCAWEATDPVLLELARLRAASLIGHEEGRHRRSATARARGLGEEKIAALGDSFSSDRFDDRERECLRFVEQFVIDVSGVTDADRGALRSVLGDETESFVTSFYITEFSQRLEMMSSRLLGVSGRSTEIALPPESATLVEPRQALGRYQDAVVRGNALDPVLTEMVRLRCARTHNCRICQTLRLVDALVAGADEEMAAKIDFYEKSDLSARTKAALRVTDAFITRPDTLSDEAVTEAQSLLSEEELAELCLDITKWSTQKIHVALGTDGADRLPLDEKGVSYFQFAGDGTLGGFAARADALS
jgi:alkylhydroperoxidase family enzyme